MDNLLDADGFGDIFEGVAITLMASRPLRRELALLRAALPPSSAADWPARPVFLEDAFELSLLLRQLLPPAPPAIPSEVAHALRHLTPSETSGIRRLISDARSVFRLHPAPSPLWLVPLAWSHRMAWLLEGQLFAADIRPLLRQRAPLPRLQRHLI